MADVDSRGLTSPIKAAAELKKKITTFVGGIHFPAGLGVNTNNIITAINSHIDAENFNIHNSDYEIIEVDATFIAKNKDGQEKFRLLVRWDADTPTVEDVSSKPSTSAKPPKPSKTTKPKQTSHYGWEMELNNARVAGPGHIFFVDSFVLPHYRLPDIGRREATELQYIRPYILGNGAVLYAETRYYENSLKNPEDDDKPSTSKGTGKGTGK
ncbi:hypothetical protein ACHAQJ_003338 [Trichoderma viride]